MAVESADTHSDLRNELQRLGCEDAEIWCNSQRILIGRQQDDQAYEIDCNQTLKSLQRLPDGVGWEAVVEAMVGA